MTTTGISVVGFDQKSGENLEAASKSNVAHGLNSTIEEGHSQSHARLKFPTTPSTHSLILMYLKYLVKSQIEFIHGERLFDDP